MKCFADLGLPPEGRNRAKEQCICSLLRIKGQWCGLILEVLWYLCRWNKTDCIILPITILCIVIIILYSLCLKKRADLFYNHFKERKNSFGGFPVITDLPTSISVWLWEFAGEKEEGNVENEEKVDQHSFMWFFRLRATPVSDSVHRTWVSWVLPLMLLLWSERRGLVQPQSWSVQGQVQEAWAGWSSGSRFQSQGHEGSQDDYWEVRSSG